MNSLSVSSKNWIQKKYDNGDLQFIKENFFLDEIVSKLLSIRKIKKDEIKSFLNPSIKNFLPNPKVLKYMDKASYRTLEAFLTKEKIGIFGDYVVDGASATALLGNIFSLLKIPFEIYIPDRKIEGYGPTKKAFKEFIEKNISLIFTVDCGTLSFEAIEFARSKKLML